MTSTRPYAGLTVLDISQGFAGPYCTQILLAQGAEVIKVEPPSGDWARLMGMVHEGHTPMSIVGNIGKQGACIDASGEPGREVIRRIARQSDVVVQNFRPGVAERLGLGAQALCADNPRLIYLSISGFGQDGPYVNRAASDSVIQAYTGMMVMNRDASGTPRRIGMLAIDALAGVYAAQLLGAALYRRATSGLGGPLDMSLTEVCAAFQAIPIVDTLLHGSNQLSVSVPAGTFKTADGLMNVVAIRDAMFRGICTAIGRLDWLDDDGLRTNAGRASRADEINAGIASALARQGNAYWKAAFDANDVLAAQVNDYHAFVADEQVLHAQIFQPIDQPGVGRVTLARVPGVRWDDARMQSSPALGEHTRQVLGRFGYSSEEVDSLVQRNIVR